MIGKTIPVSGCGTPPLPTLPAVHALPHSTYARLRARFGPQLDPWWEQLPATLADLAARWQLVIGDPVGRGNTSLVIHCTAAGRPGVLKLTPDAELTRAEALALEAWAPSGRVPLAWAVDTSLGALLLEAVRDAPPPPDVPVPAIAGLIAALHRSPAPAHIASLADRVEFVFEHWIHRHPASAAGLRRGRALARELAPGPGVLLHGDLHAGNVLDGGPARGLVAIDPRPCVGDPAFDAVDWVFWGVDDPREWEPRSRRLAAALTIDPDRLWAWCAAFATLIAASEEARGGSPARVEALRALGP